MPVGSSASIIFGELTMALAIARRDLDVYNGLFLFEQAMFLKYRADFRTAVIVFFSFGKSRDLSAVHRYLSAVAYVERAYRIEQSGLAAPGFPENKRKSAIVKFERHSFERVYCIPSRAVILYQILDFYHLFAPLRFFIGRLNAVRIITMTAPAVATAKAAPATCANTPGVNT